MHKDLLTKFNKKSGTTHIGVYNEGNLQMHIHANENENKEKVYEFFNSNIYLGVWHIKYKPGG